VYRVLVEKPVGKRPMSKWEEGIKMDLREIGWGGGGVEQIHLDWVRGKQAVVNVVMNCQVLAPWS
jgi:hypothetical protein